MSIDSEKKFEEMQVGDLLVFKHRGIWKRQHVISLEECNAVVMLNGIETTILAKEFVRFNRR